MFGKRVFFGWWVLLGIFLVYTALCGIQINTLPLFYPALMKEFRWSANDVTRAAMVFYLTGAILTSFVSSFFDRHSVRSFMLAGGVATVVGLFCYRSIHTPTQMVLVYMMFSCSQVCCGQVPTMLVVTRWFKRYRGIAIGITLMGPDLGGAIFPLIIRPLLSNGGWREALLLLMAIAGALILIPLILIVRNTPEDKGLQPDGDPAKKAGSGTTGSSAGSSGLTLKEALRMPAFYILAFATGSLWFCMNGFVQHQTIFMNTELGVSMDDLPVIISILFWFAIVGKLLTGYLSDHFDKIVIMFVVVLFLIAGLSILRLSKPGGLPGLYCYAAIFGIGYSGTFTMIQLVIAEFFAGQSYGKILGILTTVDVGAGGLAITVIAQLQGAFHSYFPVIETLIALTCLVAVSVLFLRRMRRNIQAPRKYLSAT
jgi:MFS transporter, OFA family, oxalate/formate antiporter